MLQLTPGTLPEFCAGRPPPGGPLPPSPVRAADEGGAIPAVHGMGERAAPGVRVLVGELEVGLVVLRAVAVAVDDLEQGVVVARLEPRPAGRAHDREAVVAPRLLDHVPGLGVRGQPEDLAVPVPPVQPPEDGSHQQGPRPPEPVEVRGGEVLERVLGVDVPQDVDLVAVTVLAAEVEGELDAAVQVVELVVEAPVLIGPCPVALLPPEDRHRRDAAPPRVPRRIPERHHKLVRRHGALLPVAAARRRPAHIPPPLVHPVDAVEGLWQRRAGSCVRQLVLHLVVPDPRAHGVTVAAVRPSGRLLEQRVLLNRGLHAVARANLEKHVGLVYVAALILGAHGTGAAHRCGEAQDDERRTVHVA
eukprot:CAMPEP_0171215700 /NCGR_PEP_ID=MMETSP0790-20130122/31801_1 /TAXON_ID=2925 /ORGANISM="Alexandrium catenella, Strain OF101" /LENGTH=360 /DNA_ID=CAMNT_0011681459 /DNA_START=85 /DNA_END=1167 /DNA_ORIENTATION=+